MVTVDPGDYQWSIVSYRSVWKVLDPGSDIANLVAELRFLADALEASS